jgi:hypothetical protein
MPVDDGDLREIWKEIRILQIQFAALVGVLVARTEDPERRKRLQVCLSREVAEAVERADGMQQAFGDE